jgi:hypothetical protein
LEEKQVYDFLKVLLVVAENKIGTIEEVSMGDWIKTKDRICIQGTTKEGKSFELVLEIDKEVQAYDS